MKYKVKIEIEASENEFLSLMQDLKEKAKYENGKMIIEYEDENINHIIASINTILKLLKSIREINNA